MILGEFSAVVRDVGAAKGILICTSGFAKSNYPYARTLGIELVTIEDMNSDRWRVAVEIPVVFIQKQVHYTYDIEIVTNQALVDANTDRDITISMDQDTLVSDDGGRTSKTLQQRLESQALPSTHPENVSIDLVTPDTEIFVANVWVPVLLLNVVHTVKPKYFLKYVTPSEYSQLTDHLTGGVLPLHFTVEMMQATLDESYVELDGPDAPVFTGLSLEFEEHSYLNSQSRRAEGSNN